MSEMANPENLKPFTGADDPRRVNGAPKGTKHISTWIQELLNDEDFEAELIDGKKGLVEFKGAPLKAIILTARHKAVYGDDKAREWLAKYGYGSKLTIDAGDPMKVLLDKYGLTEEVANDRKDDDSVQGSSASAT